MLIQTEAPLLHVAAALNLEIKKEKKNLKEYKKTNPKKKNNSKQSSMAMLQRIKNTKNT